MLECHFIFLMDGSVMPTVPCRTSDDWHDTGQSSPFAVVISIYGWLWYHQHNFSMCNMLNNVWMNYSRSCTCLKLTSLEKEEERKSMDPEPNQNADLPTFFHITKSTTLSQRPSQSNCSAFSAPGTQIEINNISKGRHICNLHHHATRKAYQKARHIIIVAQ